MRTIGDYVYDTDARGWYCCLGYGRFGAVYRVSRDGAQYAAKVIPTASPGQEAAIAQEIQVLQHLHKEAEAGARGHDRIIQLYDHYAQEVPGTAYPKRRILIFEVVNPVAEPSYVAPSHEAPAHPPLAYELTNRDAVTRGYSGSHVDLASWTGERGQPYRLVREVMKQIIDGVVFCHNSSVVAGVSDKSGGATPHPERYGVLQRDIKPDNILMPGTLHLPDGTAYPRIVLSDFGLAKDLAEDTKKQAGFNTKGIGTGSYMAPEIIMAHHVASDGKVVAPYGKKADAFAVGCVMFTVMTGKRAKDLCASADGFPGRFTLPDDPLNAHFPMEVHGTETLPSEQRFLLERLTKAEVADRWSVHDAQAFLDRPDAERLEVIRTITRAEAAASAAARAAEAATRAATAAGAAAASVSASAATGGAGAVAAAPSSAGAPMNECRHA